MISEKLLDIIACPICKGELKYDVGEDILICYSCKVYYPIHDDIPILLEEEAKPLEDIEE